MNINDILTTDEVKVSKNSWTIKRNDKTCGVIRNIMPFTTALSEAHKKALQAEYDAAIKRKNAVDLMSSEVNVVRCIKL